MVSVSRSLRLAAHLSRIPPLHSPLRAVYRELVALAVKDSKEKAMPGFKAFYYYWFFVLAFCETRNATRSVSRPRPPDAFAYRPSLSQSSTSRRLRTISSLSCAECLSPTLASTLSRRRPRASAQESARAAAPRASAVRSWLSSRVGVGAAVGAAEELVGLVKV